MARMKITKEFKLAKGYVGVGNKIYAEIWQIGLLQYELRISCAHSSKVFMDIHYMSGYGWYKRGSFMCAPLKIWGDYHDTMVEVERLADTLWFTYTLKPEKIDDEIEKDKKKACVLMQHLDLCPEVVSECMECEACRHMCQMQEPFTSVLKLIRMQNENGQQEK